MLTVTDNDGNHAHTSSTITVNGVAIPNEHPIVVLASQTHAHVGDVIYFDGSGSYDTDGTIIEYAWNFRDGTVLSGLNSTPSHTFSENGSYQVILTIVDDDRAGNSDNIIITISDDEPNDSIIVTNTTELIDSISNNRQPGDIIWVKTNTITGDVDFSCDGISVSHITIKAHQDFTPVFSGAATVTGDHITLEGLTFNGG